MSQDLRKYLRMCAKRISSCSDCELGGRYASCYRERNMALTIKNLPTRKIDYVILAESPPKSKEFFYSLESNGRGWLGNIVFPGFGLSVGSSPLVGEAKGELLGELESRGVIMIDSCHCACNHLGERGCPNKKEERWLRKELVLSCYRKHTIYILEKIIAASPSVYILPAFPGGLRYWHSLR